MIFSCGAVKGSFHFNRSKEVPMLYTVIELRDGYVPVPMTEEELFRKVLGDREFDRRAEHAYEKEKSR